MRKSNLFALKLSINENIFSQNLSDIKEYFLKAIRNSEKFIKKYNSVWGFMDVLQYKHQGRTLVSGRLCRGKDEKTSVVDTDDKEIKDGLIRNVAYESNFIFDLQTEIVIFEERTNTISKYQFEEVFKKLILFHEPNLGKLSSELLPAPEIIKEIDKFKKIEYAEFNLFPANWDQSDNFDELDESLKELKAQKATHRYESEDGLEKDSKLFEDPVNMILSGYGNFTMSGEDENDKPKTLETDKELLAEVIELEDNELEEFISKSYFFLLEAIKQHRKEDKNEDK